MEALETLQQVRLWPVKNASASVIADGQVWRTGDTNRIFRLASVTKPIAAWGFLVAVEEGVFDLDEPMGPDGATVRHLLAHASGVGFDSREPERAVEERRIYSSAGFDILAEAVEELSGMWFSEYLNEAVFAPLGMDNTALHGSAGHDMTSTVEDLTKFLLEVLDPTLLHPSTVDDVFTVQYPQLRGIVPGYGMQRPSPWGLGFEIHGTKSPHWLAETMPEDVAGHFGQNGTYIWVHRPTGRAMVALTDRPFGAWAKPLWAETNEAIWAELESR